MKTKKNMFSMGAIIVVFIASAVGTVAKGLVKSPELEYDPVELQENIGRYKENFIIGCTDSEGPEWLCACVFDETLEKYGVVEYTKNNTEFRRDPKSEESLKYQESMGEAIDICLQQKENES